MLPLHPKCQEVDQYIVFFICKTNSSYDYISEVILNIVEYTELYIMGISHENRSARDGDATAAIRIPLSNKLFLNKLLLFFWRIRCDVLLLCATSDDLVKE